MKTFAIIVAALTLVACGESERDLRIACIDNESRAFELWLRARPDLTGNAEYTAAHHKFQDNLWECAHGEHWREVNDRATKQFSCVTSVAAAHNMCGLRP